MYNLKYKEVSDKKTWEDFILSHNPRSFLQSWNWGEVNERLGKKIYRIGFYDDSNLVGESLIIKENAKRGPHFLIPGGPIIDWGSQVQINAFIKCIKNLAREEHVWFIRIRPEVMDSRESKKMFSELGFVSAPMHLHAENTWVLDISPPEESIVAGMRKTTRYLVRNSQKHNLICEQTIDSEQIKILSDLQKETVVRHNFVGFSDKIFRYQLETFGKDNQGKLFICRQAEKDLAAAIIIFYGDTAYYHHSGSTSNYRGIPFSYFLQWQVILEAKKRGIKYYNFWGIAPNDNPKHRFAGVTTFKKGFGGKRVDWIHARDLPVSLLYVFTYTFEFLRKVFRRL